ncbi:sulfatase-like hydrolase/transferase [Tamlana sp. 2201CG12-4]|uniref:sulfatase-like hydrolase/transferase n=1 Tax=Tamlana sp. 2201CG12-4 TaxID=3112582 RepID=UPI002DBA8E89|nr:sulfatase-like hydrolase/transferase [Tamlana sp. 2201CG12-4]MEC3905722.1 sulfatase-like hydrolase/transferase [Tamlana sp. 2201CG12-4]
MNKNILCLIIIAILTVGCKSKPGSDIAKNEVFSSKNKPNVIVILADDLGFADVGYNGCKDIPTPNIDALSLEGVTFSNGYVTGSVCGPTRAGLLTGRYQQRFGSEFNPGPRKLTKDGKVGVPLSETFISTRLKRIGYKTACFGKWHLGGESGDKDLYPLNRGFDEFFGFLEGAALYIDPENSEKKYMRGNDEVTMEEEYYTDAITRESVSFIDRNKDNPFFLYVPYNAVHAPLQAPEKYLKEFDHIKHPKRKLLAAMNFAMDKSIGDIMSNLKKHGLEENTMVFFLSDNGGKPKGNFSYNVPLRGEKGQFYEGGIHVPFVVKWKNHFPENMIYNEPVSSLDIMPTIMNAVGVQVDPSWHLDGIDMSTFIDNKTLLRPQRELFWKSNNKYAVRNNKWKIVKMGTKLELFNLLQDPYETTDLSKTHPEQVKALMEVYKKWDSKNIPAQYGYGSEEKFPYKVVRTRRTELKR